MSNVDKANGFQLITGGGRQPRRVLRTTDSGSANSLMAPGDAYALANNVIVRQTATNVACVGIMEAVALPGAAIAEGPMTYDYVPASTELDIIGIEDADAEFEVTANAALEAADYDAGAQVDIVDAAPSTTLRVSRQKISDVGGDQFKLVRPVDRPGNDPYAQYARVVVKLLPASIQ